MKQIQKYDVIVIGGGHAGIEASLAASRMGLDTLLITMDPSKIGEMSCNPSIGGVGKGQLVKEIDALGGEMGKTADYTGIQFKRLNTRKGSAVQSSRCQSDKKKYALEMQRVVAEQERLTVLKAEVKDILVEDRAIVGLLCRAEGEAIELFCKNVVITAGTFMKAVMHCGSELSEGGRFGENASNGLSDNLKRLGLTILRLKTGTPARLLRGSIDFSQMEIQHGDNPPKLFSFWGTEIRLPQVPCYLTYSNPGVHEAIRKNLARSPLYSGKIQGIGPRYCPSIEDKVVKFPDKGRHPLFFEPESLESDWIYPNGISTSLPADVQDEFLKKIPGCAEVKVARYGYAVEYDCIDARQLKPTLESKEIAGLFFGGQVNGTSGYEEAAAQGLLAGINAALRAKAEPEFTLSRAESYIGVMVDDLTTLGISEPYRMFTSRAEFRLSLREDNADLRLSAKAYKLGLISPLQNTFFESKKANFQLYVTEMQKKIIKPTEQVQGRLKEVNSSPLPNAQPFSQILKRPELSLKDALHVAEGQTSFSFTNQDPNLLETLEVEIKYEGYILLQKQEIERLKKMEGFVLPSEANFGSVAGLSKELREKLDQRKPRSLADAAKISGMTPSALSALLFHFRKKGSSLEFSHQI